MVQLEVTIKMTDLDIMIITGRLLNFSLYKLNTHSQFSLEIKDYVV